jgi:hypothetical protein
MITARVLDVVRHLATHEQAAVSPVAVGLPRSHQFTSREARELVERLDESTDPAHIIRLKPAIRGGFYRG